MKHQADLQAMRSLMEEMRDHLEQMRRDNKELKEENRKLREMLLQSRQPTREHTTIPRQDAYNAHDNTPPSGYHSTTQGPSNIRQTMNGFEKRRLTPSRGMYNLGDDLTEGSEIGYEQAHHSTTTRDDFDVYSQRAQTRQKLRGHLGAGVSATKAEKLGTTPRKRMPRPALDIGFINKVSPEELDSLPYGLVVLDTQGQVLFYNETESELTGFDRERVIGKNFFTKVAPCTQVKAFQGRFEEFVRGELGRVSFFDFAFHFEHGTQNVVIGLSHGRRRGHINVMMVRK